MKFSYTLKLYNKVINIEENIRYININIKVVIFTFNIGSVYSALLFYTAR